MAIMTSIDVLIERLKDETAWQATPTILEYDDYKNFISYGIKHLFIDTGRALEFNYKKFIEVPEGDYEYEPGLYYEEEFFIDEEEYIILLAKIAFFNRVKLDVDNIVGYTTDALSITGADKPYANIKNTLEGLENERRIIYYKMHRFSIGT